MITDVAQLNRFSISVKDFEKAIEFLEEAKKHQINTLIYEALMFSGIVCYYRPFSPNEKDPKAAASSKLEPSDFSPLNEEEQTIHEKCKELRNKALAHSEFKYHPTRMDQETGVIASAIFSFVGIALDIDGLIALARKRVKECNNKRGDYVRSVRTL
ncbi:MAG: hypothetical protein LPJ87_03690 [Zoogloeaceae bacterium]|nr:hypothetical protein [Zoogloeaceae bacterium]